MKFHRRLLLLTLVLPLSFTACSTSGGAGGGAISSNADATPEAIEEAELVRKITSQVARKFQVVPGPVTLVTFPEPAFPDDPTALRDSIRRMREKISEKLGREANRIRFVFPELTIEQ